MERLILSPVTPADAADIAAYRAAFPEEGTQATPDPDRIPGLDRLEEYPRVEDWLRACGEEEGRISWFLTRRERDGKLVGCCCLRHSLAYDDDDGDFASHIGYSVRPDEQGKGYGREQLRLLLAQARAVGLPRVRLICQDVNRASAAVIRSCGGVFAGAVRGEESGMTVERYDIELD